jgi:hypothetical protein
LVKNSNQNNITNKLNLANILCIILPTLLLVWKRSFLPPLSPLYYSRPWGQDQLAPSDHLFLLPFFSLVAFIVNFLLTKSLLSKENNFLSLTICSFSLLFSVLNTVTILKIVFLII